MAAEHGAATQDEARLPELLQRQVQRDAARIADFALHVPVIETHAIQYPLADVEDEIRLFSERNERGRRNVAVTGQPPTQQRFGADDAARAQVDFRLVG